MPLTAKATMPPFTDDDLPPVVQAPVNIGRQLKELRTKLGWTLSDASQNTGVAQSTLSKIERGELSPTLTTLQKIATGMGVELVTLLSSAAAVSAPGRRSVDRTHRAAAPLVWLASDLANKKMFPFHATITARHVDDYPAWSQNNSGEKFVYVLSGTLVIFSEFYEPLMLKTGDSVYYDASMKTKWVSEGDQDASVLWVYVP